MVIVFLAKAREGNAVKIVERGNSVTDRIDMSRREKIGSTLYDLLLALWVGGIFIYTFILTPVIFRSFPRDTASAIVDKLFPLYFPYVLVIVFLALVTFLLSGWKRSARPKLILTSLIIAVLIVLSVNLWLYPEVKKAKLAVSSFESTSAQSPARKHFMVLHGISMILNLALLADGIALIVIGSCSERKGKLA